MTRERGAISYDSLGKRVAIIIDATEISDAFREILLFNEASACSVDLSSYAAWHQCHVGITLSYVGSALYN